MELNKSSIGCTMCSNSSEDNILVPTGESFKIFNVCFSYVKDAINIEFLIQNIKENNNNQLSFCKTCLESSLNLSNLADQIANLKKQVADLTNSFSDSISKRRNIEAPTIESHLQFTNNANCHLQHTNEAKTAVPGQSQLHQLPSTNLLSGSKQNKNPTEKNLQLSDDLLVTLHLNETNQIDNVSEVVKCETNDEEIPENDDYFTDLYNYGDDGESISDKNDANDTTGLNSNEIVTDPLQLDFNTERVEGGDILVSENHSVNPKSSSAALLASVSMTPQIMLERIPVPPSSFLSDSLNFPDNENGTHANIILPIIKTEGNDNDHDNSVSRTSSEQDQENGNNSEICNNRKRNLRMSSMLQRENPVQGEEVPVIPVSHQPSGDARRLGQHAGAKRRRARAKVILECKECNLVFEKRGAKYRHMLTHRPKVVCELCGAPFERSDNLRRHMRQQHSTPTN